MLSPDAVSSAVIAVNVWLPRTSFPAVNEIAAFGLEQLVPAVVTAPGVS